MVHADLGQQVLETEPHVCRATAQTEVFIDHKHAFRRPAQGDRVIGQGVLHGE
jgi:hypothetical protein